MWIYIISCFNVTFWLCVTFGQATRMQSEIELFASLASYNQDVSDLTEV